MTAPRSSVVCLAQLWPQCGRTDTLTERELSVRKQAQDQACVAVGAADRGHVCGKGR